MKKLLLFACALGAFSTFAQTKDVSVTLTSPAEGTTIMAGQNFDVTFTVTNSGTIPLTITDSVYFGLYLNNQNIFGNSIFWAETANTALAAGASYVYTIEDLYFNSLPTSGAQNFCAALFLYEGTASEPTTEDNSTNNVDCNSVTTQAGTVGINDLIGFNDNISMYPNPATDKVTFSTLGATAAKVNIYSITGSLVGTVMLNAEGTTEYNVSDLNSGMYVANFVAANGNQVTTQKFTVK